MNEMEIKLAQLAREKLRKGWITEDFAKDKHHSVCQPEDPNACCFCMMGAVRAAAHEIGINARPDVIPDAILQNVYEALTCVVSRRTINRIARQYNMGAECVSVADINDNAIKSQLGAIRWIGRAIRRLGGK